MKTVRRGKMAEDRRAFTLIELLVVIAIISLLLAIVAPGLRKAKESAKSVVCRSNLRQMSVGFSTYAMENDDRMFSFGYDEDYWFRKIAPYLGDKDFQGNPTLDGSGVMGIGICPSTKIQTEKEDGTYNTTWRFNTGNSEYIVGSYGVNAWVLDDVYEGKKNYYYVDMWHGNRGDAESRRYERYGRIRSDVGILADAFRFDVWPSTVAGCELQAPTTKEELLQPKDLDHDLKKFMRRYTVDRHGMAVNVAFAGGSVDKVSLEDLYMTKWNKADGPNSKVRIPAD